MDTPKRPATRRRRRRHRYRVLVLVVAATAGLAGCDSGSSPAPSSSAPPSSAVPSSSSSTPTPSSPSPTASALPGLVWSDEFTGAAGTSPDPSKWTAQVGGGGWGNHELECYTNDRSNSALDGQGHLVITARRDPHHVCADGQVNDYTSARFISASNYTATHGTIEMRAKLPVQPGVWPAFWALGANHATVGWPECGEIDVVEVAGARPTSVYSSLHGPTADGSPYAITKIVPLERPVSDSYHVYAASWTPSTFRFSVDGQTTLTVARNAVEKRGAWVFDKPFQLLMNVAVGGVFGGSPNSATTWPRQMSIDYVRVFRH